MQGLAAALPFPMVGMARDCGRQAALASLSDETLMSRYRDGEPEAFEILYRRHRAGLHRFVRRMIPQDADELFQDVWIAVIAGRAHYMPSARFVTYLFTIAHHRAVARWRRRGVVMAEEEALDAADDAPDPLHATLNAELGLALHDAIAGLPLLQREAFLMQAEGGLSLEEIAQASGASKETVKSRLRYAHKALRSALEAWK